MYVCASLQNDIWQAQSWASVQYDLSWKILHHYMKTVYHSMLVSAYQYEGYFGIYVVNDMPHSTGVDFELYIRLITWAEVRTINMCGVNERDVLFAHTNVRTRICE